MQYDKNKIFKLLLDPIPIKSLPDVTKVLCSLIVTSIKEGGCYGEWKFVARHFENGSSMIQDVGFDQSYSPVTHDYSLRISIDIEAMNILTARVLDVRYRGPR